jgi:hypothetical protein
VQPAADLTLFRWNDGAALAPKHLQELAGVQGAVEEEPLEDFLHAVPPEDKPRFEKLAGLKTTVVET